MLFVQQLGLLIRKSPSAVSLHTFSYGKLGEEWEVGRGGGVVDTPSLLISIVFYHEQLTSQQIESYILPTF